MKKSAGKRLIRAKSSPKPADSGRTRERIIYLLKTSGPCTAAELSKQLSMTAMGVRRHLSQLELDGLVEHSVEQQQRGRPTHKYRLTPTGDELFPRRYVSLAKWLVDLIVELDGADKLREIMKIRSERQIASYRESLDSLSLAERVKRLARLRDEEGYMGSWEILEDGSLMLTQNNCALCEIAEHCPELCDTEINLFRSILPEADIERIQHIASGDKCCVYKIRNKTGN